MKLWPMLFSPLALLVSGEIEEGTLHQDMDGAFCQEEKSSRCVYQENDFRAPDFDHSKLKVKQGRLGT